MMLRIVGLNSDKVFYQVKRGHVWEQYTKPVNTFVHMMFTLFPILQKQVRSYGFDNIYSVANWLYNYGEAHTPNAETYIFYYHR